VRAGRRTTGLAALLLLAAIGCGLDVSGTAQGPDGSTAADTAIADGSYSSSSGGGSSGGESSDGFDAVVAADDDGSIVEDAGASPDSSSGADAGPSDAADAGGPCQVLAACCSTIMSSAGANLQGCLAAAKDGGTATCETTLALLQSFLLCL
jgi:hypothetical protein